MSFNEWKVLHRSLERHLKTLVSLQGKKLGYYEAQVGSNKGVIRQLINPNPKQVKIPKTTDYTMEHESSVDYI